MSSLSFYPETPANEESQVQTRGLDPPFFSDKNLLDTLEARLLCVHRCNLCLRGDEQRYQKQFSFWPHAFVLKHRSTRSQQDRIRPNNIRLFEFAGDLSVRVQDVITLASGEHDRGVIGSLMIKKGIWF